MAKIERGSFSITSTGNHTILFNDSTILADEIEFSMGPIGSTSENINHSSDGFCTPTQQCCKATYSDTTGGRVTQVNNKTLTYIQRVSGSLTNTLEATRSSMATTGEFTLNATVAPAAVATIYFRARQY